jgi:hypothetical protein
MRPLATVIVFFAMSGASAGPLSTADDQDYANHVLWHLERMQADEKKWQAEERALKGMPRPTDSRFDDILGRPLSPRWPEMPPPLSRPTFCTAHTLYGRAMATTQMMCD